MGISKGSLIALFVCAFLVFVALCDKSTEPCPVGHLVERAPDNCEWFLRVVTNGSRSCPMPVLVCRGTSTTTSSPDRTRNQEINLSDETSIATATTSSHVQNASQPCGPNGCGDGYVCMKDKSRMGFVHAGFNKARCVKGASGGVGLCPMPFLHPDSGTCSPNCQNDDDCSHGHWCCDIGCGLRCSRVVPLCDNRALPHPIPTNCHLEETQGLLGRVCRNFSLHCVENGNQTVIKPMPTLVEVQNQPDSKNAVLCTSNSDCPGGQICTLVAKDEPAQCVLVQGSGTAICPVVKTGSDLSCDAENCTADDGKCSGDKMCCDIGCGSAKCVRSLDICNGHFPFPNLLADSEKCSYKITMSTRRLPQQTPCAILQEVCPSSKTSPAPNPSLDSSFKNQRQKPSGGFCEEDTCAEPLLCIEVVKQNRENGTKIRKPTCVKTNTKRTKLCPAYNLGNEGTCKSDCSRDEDCSNGEMCCDIGCGLRCSRPKPVCGRRILRKGLSGRTCYHEEVLPEEDGPCRNVRFICKRPPWRSQRPFARKADPAGSSPSRDQIPQALAPSPADKCRAKGCGKIDRKSSVCVDDKVTDQIQCVRVDAVGAGMCPIIPATNSCSTEPKKAECSADDQCLTGHLCCPVACGLAKCIFPKPACDAKPIKNVGPNCYFERAPTEGRLACHNLRLVCIDELGSTGASGYPTFNNGTSGSTGTRPRLRQKKL